MSLVSELKRRNVIRIAVAYIVGSWLLIQVAETILPLFGVEDSVTRILVIVLAIGFIPGVILAWVFELTPEGLKRESEVDRSRSGTPDADKTLDRAVMVVLALAVAYFGIDKFVLDSHRDASLAEQKTVEVKKARQEGRTEALVDIYGEKSIAVLPFVNMSSDAEQEYFSDGISEELLNLLAQIPELRVISRTSAFSYRDKDISLAQVAEELNVAHILEGSVRKAGNQIRITAQLIEARSDTHLWSRTYDRQLDNIFVIQDEIAASVVEGLKITLLGAAPQAQDVDPQAYALYLQARYLARKGSAEGFDESNALYRQALAIDSNYPSAWNAVAVNYTNLAGLGLLPAAEGYNKAREATNKALAINPDYAKAHANLGWIAMNYDKDLAQAARHFQRALQLDPTNVDIIRTAAALLPGLGRVDKGIELYEYASARDPVSPAGHFNLGLYNFFARRWDAATVALRTTLRLSPNYFGAHYRLGTVLMLQGDAHAALLEVQQEPFEAYRLIGEAMVQHALGDHSASDAALNELIENHSRGWAYNIAYVLAYRNESDRAFEWLGKAVEYGDAGLFNIAVMPFFSNITQDSRWLPFLESIGKSPDQLNAIKFKVTRPAD